MLTIHSLIHTYGSETSLAYPDWKVDKSNHSMILGGSGSGKTTLLHLIGGLLKPTEGEVIIGGSNLSTMNQASLDKFRGENIGIVFQKSHLVSSLSVLENLTLGQYLGKGKVNKEEAIEMLEQLDISALKSRKVHQVSQGQAQRVSIARALLNKPQLLLADEPTASLDDKNCEKVIRLLKSQAESNGSTLIVATHDQRVKLEFENRLEL
ncbi:MAG: ATP-binding cassette domain-containing protein [Cyclobacteriaceae bacterium]